MPDGPLNPPLVMASTYHAGGDVGYGRYGNPTWELLETTVGALEGGVGTSFASGIAPVTAVLELVPPGGTDDAAGSGDQSGSGAGQGDDQIGSQDEIEVRIGSSSRLDSKLARLLQLIRDGLDGVVRIDVSTDQVSVTKE